VEAGELQMALKQKESSSDRQATPALDRRAVGELANIEVRGAKEHNLKNIDVDIPKKKLVVFTGVSGSGKSSLAFDTIYAEGQRRYVESLSSYARQFLGQMEKPKYETIRGLAPTIAIEQKAASNNPRSTVGTITEIYDYLRVLFARIGVQYCPKCGSVVGRGDAASMVSQIMEFAPGTKILILAPLVDGRKGEHRELFDELRREGFSRVRIDGFVTELESVQALAKNKKHHIETVVDRLVIKKDPVFTQRLTETVETALKLGNGRIIVHILGEKDIIMSETLSCCNHAFVAPEPPHFSFNAPAGMCQSCNGLGHILTMDEDKIIPDKTLSIREGAVVPWKGYFSEEGDLLREGSWGTEMMRAMEKQWKINFDTPWHKLPQKQKRMILYGEGAKELQIKWKTAKIDAALSSQHEGVVNMMMRRYLKTESEAAKSWYAQFMSSKTCPECRGERIRQESRFVKVDGSSIVDFSRLPVKKLYERLQILNLTASQALIAGELLREIKSRLGFLINVGLDYLSLDRKGPTLSGGEAQRIRLASQIGSELTGVLYILDEPSIGLHQVDNKKLLSTLGYLRDLGNTLIVVEHDEETIEAADWVIDFGPGAGELGGAVIAQGPPEDIKANPQSLTGRYLAGAEELVDAVRKRPIKKDFVLTIKGATENNLKNIDVSFPLGVFVAITGVSGAGKSSLINQILYPALAQKINREQIEQGRYKSIEGLAHIDKVINIDQKPIGRTPRSNPATYTKLFGLIRDFFARLPESQARGYQPGRFSFNVKGGRCENCQGDGYITVAMHFLADVLVPCDVCKGKRFNATTLEVHYKNYNIADILDMTVAHARELFARHPKLCQILDTLIDVGLGYIRLGQPATTLSGGEAQRIKLARELARRDTGKTLYILDEPTTGLHFDDIKKLMRVLQRLIDAGNSVVVIEHNLDVIRQADWIIDIGPEGGEQGGHLVATGTPAQIVACKNSYTGQMLAKYEKLR
jgi:excinuclease ABC subunit A